MSRTKEKARYSKSSNASGRIAVMSICVWMGLNLTLEDPGKLHPVLNLIASFQYFDMARLLLLPGLYFLFLRTSNLQAEGKRWTCLIPACFFALNMVLGFSFFEEGSWNMLLELKNGQLIKAVFVCLSWTAVLDAGLKGLYAGLDKLSVLATEVNPISSISRKRFHPLTGYLQLFQNRPFLTPFLTMLVLFIPHFLIAYPAMFMGDTWSIIVQGYPELGMTGVTYLQPESIIRTGIYINQHHPVVYTLLVHLFLQVGTGLFGSLNAGIFLLCLSQSVCILSVFAHLLSVLHAAGIKPKILLLILLYIILHPQIRNFLFMVTKDGLYAACFLLMMAESFPLLEGKTISSKNVIRIVLAALGMLLLRNEGKYVLILSGILVAWANRENRKKILCFTAAAVLFSWGVTQGLYPFLGFTKGGRQEALSIPLQQTARIVKEHPEDISAEEQEAIDAVLDFSQLAESYNPDTADGVKNLFRQEASSEDLLHYFRTWLVLALRHPDTCLQATYGNYYQYLYPGDTRIRYDTYGWSAWMCNFTNEKIAGLEKSFTLPKWNQRFRYISDSLVDAGLLHFPPISLMMTPALYNWMLIALLCWVCRKKDRRSRSLSFIMLLPSLLTFLVLFAGPTNGYYTRYMLPLTSFMPFLPLMLILLAGSKDQSR